MDTNGNGKIDSVEKTAKKDTVENLREKGFLPQQGTGVDKCVLGDRRLSEDESVLMKNEMENWTSDKTSRRDLIAKCYRVVLLVGDSLGDFIGYKKNGEYLDLALSR